jgi:DNA-binding SARP family transcriptional activator
MSTHHDAGEPATGISEFAPIPAGFADGQDLLLDVSGQPGISLTGPGALAVTRALTVAMLARRRSTPARVVIPHDDLDSLFQVDPIRLPGLTVTSDLPAALAVLEADLIRRERELETEELVQDLGTRPLEVGSAMLQPTVLIATTKKASAARLEAILQAGFDRGISAILLGEGATHITGPGIDIAADGTVIAAPGSEPAPFTSAVMFTLSPDEARLALRTAVPASRTPAHGIAQDDPAEPPGHPPPANEGRPHVRLLLLGTLDLHVEGAKVRRVRRKGVEVLTYLALHPDGASTETLANTVWPDVPEGKAIANLYTVIDSTRRRLREMTGADEAWFILHAADRYRLDPATFTVDYWDLRHALAQYSQATNRQERTILLESAAALVRGPLDAWPTLDWLESWRDTVRREIADTYSRLASALQNDDPQRALDALEQALRHDPYSEELYRSIMRVQADLGRRDAVLRTFRLVQARLADIEAEPNGVTRSLLRELLR